MDMAEDDVSELQIDISLPHYTPTSTHLKTYTAGEDGSRLADMAKEFGLEKSRTPRRQVRAKTRSAISKNAFSLLFDPTFMDVRMRAVWTSHGLLEEDEQQQQQQQQDSFYCEMQEIWQQMDMAAAQDSHASDTIGGSLTSAVLGIIKGMVGPAILYLPHGFAKAGYVTAIPIMLGATLLYLYSSRCLLDSWKLESEGKHDAGEETPLLLPSGSKRRRRRVLLSYPELAYRALGSTGESTVKAGIALMQSGVCLTYLIFVPQNLHTSLQQLFGWNIAPEYYLIVMVLIQIPLSWIRDIRKLTLTNVLANALILYGLLTCLGFALGDMTMMMTMTANNVRPLQSIWNRLISLSPYQSSWFLFIGTCVSVKGHWFGKASVT
jgi:proton-coupled amino acid transporter